MAPPQMVLPAPAKVNLNLHIHGRREDGMHLLSGQMILVDLQDRITLTLRTDGKIVRQWQHAQVATEDDIALKAAQQLQKCAGCHAFGVEIAIEKNIPIGGGLGGASSNAATVLIGLNRLWQLDWRKEKLLKIAISLGADVPFFFHGLPSAVSGIGDIFHNANIDINNYLLVFPPVAAMTVEVYKEYARLTNVQKIDRIPSPLEKSDNDLTLAAVNLYPPIKQVAEILYQVAGEARLSGSGSTLFAVFASHAEAQQARQKLPVTLAATVANALVQHPLENLHITDGE